MTLGEAKRRVLMLLDEYSSGGELTVDEDLALRMNDFFDAAQKDMALYQPVVRRAVLTADASGRCTLPEDAERVLCVRRSGRRTARWTRDGRTLTLSDGRPGEAEIAYCAAVQTVGPDTPDSYVFEVSEAAANCLPFFVAAQQLIADLVVDYGAFYQLYLTMRGALSRSGPEDLSGGARQTLFRG